MNGSKILMFSHLQVMHINIFEVKPQRAPKIKVSRLLNQVRYYLIETAKHVGAEGSSPQR
jgi:hypothetical protein